jgi:glycosyltransferase involved in cell wall biosynthesis
LRILQTYKVYPPDVHGGISEVMARISQLRTMSHDVRILVARDRGLARRYLYDDTPVEAVASLGQLMSMPIAPGFPFALKRAMQECDVLALHVPFPLNDFSLLFGIPETVAVVLHWHSEIAGARSQLPFIESMLRNTVRRADRIVVTDAAMIHASPFLSKVADKCDVVPYGVDVAFWSAVDLDDEAAIDRIRTQHPRMVISIGRLVPYKGYPVLLEAMQQVDAELVLIGEGSQGESLKAQAKRLGLDGRVHFKGYLSRAEMKRHLHAARVFVLPSISEAEGFGIVQVEAMASGLPVINTNLNTTVPLIARHEIEGLTVEVGDAPALAKAINRLIGDDELSARLAANGRRRAETTYSNSAFLTRMQDVYQRACHARSRATS